MNNERFNNNIFKMIDISKPNDDRNIIMSGLSIKMAFAMLLNGAEGKSKEELVEFLGKNREELNFETKKILDECGEDLKLADVFWIREPNQINERYRQLINEYQNAEIKVDDFNSPFIVEKMNKWISDNTKGLIDNVISNVSSLESVLINALYFKAQWAEPFSEYSTYDKEFRGKDKTSTVKMMRNTTKAYLENEYAKGCGLYYENSPYEFIAVLPNTEGEFKIEDLDLNHFNYKEGNYSVNLEFPKLDVEFGTELQDVLGYLGLNAPFENSNDFVSMLSFPQKVSKIIHKTKFKLDENGTEAAAVTAIELERCAAFIDNPPTVINLVFDRPFAFMIRHIETKELLFVGKIYNL